MDALGAAKDAALRTAVETLRVIPGSAARGLRRDLRDFAWLRHADAVVVSFPKSGRTFVRAMLARLYQLQFGLDERRLLDFQFLRHAPAAVPRLLFTHAGDAMRRPGEIEVRAEDYAHCRLAVLARHPANAAVSRYYHLKYRSHDKARRRLADQKLEAFVWSERGGIPAIVSFLNCWARIAEERGDVPILRYEDFLRAPRDCLSRLAGAIGLNSNAEDLRNAVEFAEIENLRELERTGYFLSKRLRPANKDDANSFKVRTGGAGDYRTRLGDVEADKIDTYISTHLDPAFGYARQ